MSVRETPRKSGVAERDKRAEVCDDPQCRAIRCDTVRGSRVELGAISLRVRSTLAAWCLSLLLLPTTAAHDFAFTDTVAILKADGTYQIDLTVDLDALALGEPASADNALLAARIRAMDDARRNELAASLRELITRRVRVRFDGMTVPPIVSFPELGTPLADQAPIPSVFGITARLAGRIPDNARSFTFWASRGFVAVRLTVVDVRAGRMARQILGVAEESAAFSFAAGDAAGLPPELPTASDGLTPDAAVPPSQQPAARPAEPRSPARDGDWENDDAIVYTAPRWMLVSLNYLKVGFEHIIPKGIDHILFVLGLYLLGSRWRPLLWQVTAFTIAHSVTLALCMLGWISLSPRVVEPLIAASIAYVAVENIVTARLHWWRPLLVFGFGLLHGLGFAGVLSEWGVPRREFVPALIAFNVGVEIGQLAVIAAAFVAVGWLRNRPWYRRVIVVPASVCIALIGVYWAVERAVGG